MYDVIIVGAGPGGATAATFMAREGLRVALLDKATFPRDKICGDAISGKSVSVMRQLGVLDQLKQIGSQDSWGITFGVPSGDEIAIPFTSDFDRPTPPAFVCPRQSFDAILFDAAVAAGVEVFQNTQVEKLLWEGEQVAGVQIKDQNPIVPSKPKPNIPNPKSIRAPMVVGADGAYSVVVRELGLPQLNEKYYAGAIRVYYEGVTGFNEHHFMEIHFLEESTPGYFWIFPLGDGRANVGVGMLSHAIKKQKIRLKDLLEVCVQHPRFRERFEQAKRVGSVKGWGLPLGSKPRSMAGAGWMLLGDAASLIDPFTGEGIGNAMVGGREAAKWAALAKEKGEYSAAFLRGYDRAMNDYLHSELRLSHAIQRLTGWKGLINFVVRKAKRSEELADLLSCMFDDEDQRRQLLSPLFYLRLLAA